MDLLLFLIGFPVIVALLLLIARADVLRDLLVRVSALVIAAASVWLVVKNQGGQPEFMNLEGEAINYAMLAIEAGIALLITYLGIKHRKPLAVLLIWAQLILVGWFELTHAHSVKVEHNLFVDNFSIIMALIIGIIGSAIIVYALGYMKDFQHHHEDQPDRRPLFFFVMFLFLGAMFGVVFANNLIWLYFFWEITSLSSFLLIGHTRTKEAIDNSFLALVYNLLGGLGFAVAIVILGGQVGILELNKLLDVNQLVMNGQLPPQIYGMVLIAVVGLSFAGIAKAAQLPFSGWLLGAMVAPTPTSALLHSSTMVKAGVYLILRLSPLYAGNLVGVFVALIGIVTFVFGAGAAVSTSNAKRVLAWSTISNLGLIVACAGIGTSEAVWAGILLVIFHAIAKSLLFLSVGTVEHHVGSRDIEDMDNLIVRMPKIAVMMVVGIMGMFLAPFGMLLSKWAALKAFVDSGNIFLIVGLAFGSALTLFFWTKWLGKLIAVRDRAENVEKTVHKDEWIVLFTHALLVVAVCFLFPLVSKLMLVPYLDVVFGSAQMGLSDGNIRIMAIMLAVVVLIPFAMLLRNKDEKIVDIYLAGRNLATDPNNQFRGSLGTVVENQTRSYYLKEFFAERRLQIIGIVITTTLMIVVLSFILAQVAVATLGGVM